LTGKVLPDILPGHPEQRSDKAGLSSRQDAAETRRSRTSKEAEENCLGLIRGGVTGCNPIDQTGVAPLGEEPEAGLTARLLEIPHHRPPARHVTGKTASQTPDEGLILVGGSATQAVVYVQDDERSIMQRTQSVEEENAVRSSRYRHSERATGDSQPIQRRCNRVEHVSH